MERANRVFRWHLVGSLHWFVTWPLDGFGAGMRAISRLIFGSSRGSVPKNRSEGVCNGFVARLEKHRPSRFLSTDGREVGPKNLRAR